LVESCFEIKNGLSITGSNDFFIREYLCQGLLLGAKIGFVYGADGVWQWRRIEESKSSAEQISVDSALSLPASSQLSIIKSCMVENRWFSLNLRRDYLLAGISEFYIAVAANDSTLICYYPIITQYVTIYAPDLGPKITIQYINPITGESKMMQTIYNIRNMRFDPNGEMDYAPDWILLIKRYSDPTLVDGNIISNFNFKLSQNYPNPFNPSTTIKYSVPIKCFVEIVVYDLLGRKAATLVNEFQNSGEYDVNFKPDNLPSGVYYLRLSAGEVVKNIKMLYIK
jgi:hypothetical protein